MAICPNENQIFQFVTGALAPDDAASFEAHVEGCLDCQRKWAAAKLGLASTVTRDGGATVPSASALSSGPVAESPAVPSSPVAIGEVVADKYVVEKLIGEGGMGVVVRARHQTLGHPVALKFLHRALVTEPEATRRFLQEARATSRLTSPYVTRILDMGTHHGGFPFIAMELLEGTDLAAELERRGRLTTAEVVGILDQLLDALVEAHRAGIVHRDLKPSNLFLTKTASGKPHLKVIDFGVSKWTDPSAAKNLATTQQRSLLGSPVYMAPEQVLSAAAADARADLWSVGCIAYELLTGKPPFAAPSLPELIANILQTPPPPLLSLAPDVPADLVELVEACLAKSRDDRPDDAVELQEWLSRCVERAATPLATPAVTVPPSSTPMPPPTVPPTAVPSKRGWVLTAMVLMTLIALGWLWWGRGPEQPYVPDPVARPGNIAPVLPEPTSVESLPKVAKPAQPSVPELKAGEPVEKSERALRKKRAPTEEEKAFNSRE